MCFRFRSFCFPSAFFRPLLFRFRLLSSLFLPFPSSWPCLSVALPVLRFFLSASPFSTLFSAWFPMLLFRFPVLGFLFVSFHPSRFRSHSRSTGASLPLSLPGFPLTSAFFRPLLFRAFRLLSGFFRSLQLASDYSAFCSFFSLLPVFPWQRFLRCLSVPFVPDLFLFRLACFHAFLPIPVLSFLRFLSPLFCFVSQALRSSWPPVSSSAIPLCFRFRFWLLGLSVLNFSVRLRPRIYYHFKTQMSIPIFYLFELLSCTM